MDHQINEFVTFLRSFVTIICWYIFHQIVSKIINLFCSIYNTNCVGWTEFCIYTCEHCVEQIHSANYYTWRAVIQLKMFFFRKNSLSVFYIFGLFHFFFHRSSPQSIQSRIFYVMFTVAVYCFILLFMLPILMCFLFWCQFMTMSLNLLINCTLFYR